MIKSQQIYRRSLQVGIILSISAFATVSVINCQKTTPLQSEVNEESFGAPTAEQHMEEIGELPDTFVVTAYLAIDEYEKRFHGITFSGVPAKPYHTVAVDPDVIPIGAWVYIEGLGWWKAEDTGNMIKGNRLDICVPSRLEAMEWGKQKRQVWYLDPDYMNNQNKTFNASIETASIDGKG